MQSIEGVFSRFDNEAHQLSPHNASRDIVQSIRIHKSKGCLLKPMNKGIVFKPVADNRRDQHPAAVTYITH